LNKIVDPIYYLCFEFDASSDFLFEHKMHVEPIWFLLILMAYIMYYPLNTTIWLACEILLALLILTKSKYSFFALDD